jgi:hypothetical protein
MSLIKLQFSTFRILLFRNKQSEGRITPPQIPVRVCISFADRLYLIDSRLACRLSVPSAPVSFPPKPCLSCQLILRPFFRIRAKILTSAAFVYTVGLYSRFLCFLCSKFITSQLIKRIYHFNRLLGDYTPNPS